MSTMRSSSVPHNLHNLVMHAHVVHPRLEQHGHMSADGAHVRDRWRPTW